MTNKDLKDIVAQIQKYAKPPPPKPGGGGTPAPGGPPKPGVPAKPSGGGGGGYTGGATAKAEVMDMQVAMQELAQAVIQDATSATMAKKPKDALSPEADEPTKSSKKAFNDFIAEQYIGGLDDDMKGKGVEWTTDKSITTIPGKKKTETDIYELDVVMNTLKRIGMEKSEFKPDGNWGARTDNALRNMMGFGYALLQLEGDFGLKNNIYNYAAWQDFQQTLSGYTITGETVNLKPEEKKAKADRIAKHLRAITKLYNHFRQQVTARPEYRPLIEGARAFEKYNQKGSNKDVLTKDEDNMSKSDAMKIEDVTYIAPGLPGGKLTYIPMKALTSRDEYMKWMLDYAKVPSEEMAVKIFNNVIKPAIEKK
jgi:hypothetical protein